MLVNVYQKRILRAGCPTGHHNHICQVRLVGPRKVRADDRTENPDGSQRMPTWVVMVEKPAGWMDRRSWLVLVPKWDRDGRLVGILDEAGEQVGFEPVRASVPAGVVFG